eukprot:34642-Prymnesium_polylepis.2
MQLIATTIEEQQFSPVECMMLKDATTAIDASLSTIEHAGDIAMPLSISTGVGMGKLASVLTPYGKIVLKHVRMNHASVQRMLISEQSGDGSRMDKDALRQFIRNGCDICNSMKMKLFDPKKKPVDVEGDAATAVATKLVCDSFGPMSVPSAQQNFLYAHLYVVPAKTIALIRGSNDLSAETFVELDRSVIAAIQRDFPGQTIEVIRTDSFHHSSRRSATRCSWRC